MYQQMCGTSHTTNAPDVSLIGFKLSYNWQWV